MFKGYGGFSIFSFGDHPEWNHFSNFGRGSAKEHFCEIILKSGHLPRRRCCLTFFLFLALVATLFSRVEPFVQFW